MLDRIPIPDFPENRSLEFADKGMFDAVFAELQPRVSEFTFAGLYLFRRAHDYRLAMVGDSLTVLGRGYNGASYFLPPFRGDVAGALERLFAAGYGLYGADEPFARKYLQGARNIVSEDRDSFDYLYLKRDLAELPGNRYHKKKNRVNYFTSRHGHAVELYGAAHRSGCLDLLAEWRRVADGNRGRSFGLEVEATAEALHHADGLGLEGVVVLVGEKVKAFALGERLNHETAVCHFEKADPFMEGIGQLVDREFNRLLFTDCVYVNREQDLGEPGLRAAKLSYHPVELVKKFRAQGLLA
jgi:hypothetical protein